MVYAVEERKKDAEIGPQQAQRTNAHVVPPRLRSHQSHIPEDLHLKMEDAEQKLTMGEVRLLSQDIQPETWKYFKLVAV